jgi:conserved domain protein
MGYMLLGTFLIAGSMGALEVDQIGWEQFILQLLIGLIISLYGFYKDKAVMDAEEQECVVYISRVRTHGDYCKNPYYK